MVTQRAADSHSINPVDNSLAELACLLVYYIQPIMIMASIKNVKKNPLWRSS